ncbi:staygreen family protein [Piscibacillus sp. B03]|uniref:staygreen family protein n=1 Tax=Piscibacillus sp. B03 TaxID=3457430 RepID=UPI003FCDF50A
MSEFNPSKLSVEYRDQVTDISPIVARRHTLTHSDETGDLFLTAGLQFAYDLINDMRDEVIGEWIQIGDDLVYHAHVFVGGLFDESTAAIRNEIFRRELPLALTAIRYGEEPFFQAHPDLDQVPIIIHFNSSYPQFHVVESWGTFSDYKYAGAC